MSIGVFESATELTRSAHGSTRVVVCTVRKGTELPRRQTKGTGLGELRAS